MDLRQIIGIFEPIIPTSPGKMTASIGSYLNSLVTDYAPEIQDAMFRVSADLTIFSVELVFVIILTYYLLVESGTITTELFNLFPDRVAEVFLRELNYIYQNLFIVYFLTCFFSGIAGAILYWLLGVPYPFIWGIITFILALLPVVGPGTVYGLLAFYYALIEDFFTASALFFLGIFFLSLVPDLIIRPRLAKRRAEIHPAITLLAFAAPLFVIGPIGIIIGPLAYGFLLAAYRTRKIITTASSPDEDSTGPVFGPEMGQLCDTDSVG